MTAKFIYNISKEPNGALYNRILETAVQFCDSGLLVLRETVNVEPSAIRVINAFQSFMLQQTTETKWPGTELLGGETATVYRFRLCAATVEILNKTVSGLYSWQQPDFPEDLCLLRQDGCPWLVSIAHEGDSYFEMTPDEKDALLTQIPELKGYVE